MADKKIVFQIDILTKNVEQAIARLGKQFDLLNGKLNGTSVGSKQYQYLTTNINKTAAATDKLNGSLAALNNTGKGTSGMFLNITRYFSGLLVITQVVSALKSAANAFLDFNNVMQKNLALSQSTEEEYERLNIQAGELAKSTIFTSVQVASLQTELIKLGFSLPTIEAMTQGILNLAAALDADLAKSANVIGSIARQFKVADENLGSISDLISTASVKSANDLDTLSASMKYVGTSASAIGYDLKETVSILNVLANTGIKGSSAGTSLNQALIEMVKGNSKAVKSLGFTVKSLDDLNKALDVFTERGYEVEQLAEIFNVRSARAVVSLIQNRDALDEQTAAMDRSYGSAERMAALQLDTLTNDIELLKSNFKELTKEGLNPLDDTFRSIVQSINNFIDTLRDTGTYLKEHKTLLTTLKVGLGLLTARFIASRTWIQAWSIQMKLSGLAAIKFGRSLATTGNIIRLYAVQNGIATAASVTLGYAVHTLRAALHSLKAAFLSNPIGIAIVGLSLLLPLLTKVKDKTVELTEAEIALKQAREAVEGDDFTAYGKWNKHLEDILKNMLLIESSQGEYTDMLADFNQEAETLKNIPKWLADLEGLTIPESTAPSMEELFSDFIIDLKEYDLTSLGNQLEDIILTQKKKIGDIKDDLSSATSGTPAFDNLTKELKEGNSQLDEYIIQLGLVNVEVEKYEKLKADNEPKKFDNTDIKAELLRLQYLAKLAEAEDKDAQEIHDKKLAALNYEYKYAFELSGKSAEKQLAIERKINIQKIKNLTELTDEQYKLYEYGVKKSAEDNTKRLKAIKQAIELELKLNATKSTRTTSLIDIEEKAIDLKLKKELIAIDTRYTKEEERILLSADSIGKKQAQLTYLEKQTNLEKANAAEIRSNNLFNLKVEQEEALSQLRFEQQDALIDAELEYLNVKSGQGGSGQKAIQKQIIQLEYESDITELEASIADSQKIIETFELDIAALRTRLAKAATDEEKSELQKRIDALEEAKKTEEDIIKKSNDTKVELQKSLTQALKDIDLESVMGFTEQFQAAVEGLTELSDTVREIEEAKIEADYERRSAALTLTYNNQLKALGLYNKESSNLTAAQNRRLNKINEKQALAEEKLEAEKEQKSLDLKKRYADKEFALQVAGIISSTALAIMKVWADNPNPVYAGIMTGVVGAIGAVQISSASQQRNAVKSLGDGGEISGPSHAQGGVSFNGGEYELEGGEFIVNKKSMSNPVYADIVRGINAKGVTGSNLTRQYAQGGEINSLRGEINNEFSVEMIQTIVQETVGGILAIPVVNVANDTETANNRIRSVQNTVSFS